MKNVRRRIRRPVQTEFLEDRILLAGDFAAGDANRDYYFDEADVVQVSKLGFFETGLTASWEQGDWTGDSIYNSSDLVEAFRSGAYRMGAYDEAAADPVNELAAISTSGDTDTTVYYASTSGDVAITHADRKVTSVHFVSQSGLFLNSELQYLGIFDAATNESQFVFYPSGKSVIVVRGALATGLSQSQLLGDLLIDGAIFGGGGLGTVHLQLVDTLPDRLLETPDPDPPGNGPPQIESFAAGDSNKDLYFDESDFIFAMKSGKFDSEEPATWAEGDWNGDGFFDSHDFVVAFQEGAYRQGAYSENAGEPVNELAEFSTDGVADVTIYYDPVFGDIVALSRSDKLISSIQIESARGQFTIAATDQSIFDVANATSRFNLIPPGQVAVYWEGVLPLGLKLNQIIEDVTVDGSMLPSGDLGIVHLEHISALPEDAVPPDLLNPDRPTPGETFVDIAHANALLSYDPANGDVTLLGINTTISAIELVSQSGFFVGTETNEYGPVGLFDISLVEKVFRLRPEGITTISFPGIGRLNQTLEELTADLIPTGTLLGNGAMRVAAVISKPADTIVGDANSDYYFDESDILQMFKSRKFGTDTNATWSEGDWNHDFRFDKSDLQMIVNDDYAADAYSPKATDPKHERLSFSNDEFGDLNLQYDPETGNVLIQTNSSPLVAVHLTSHAGLLRNVDVGGDFGVSSESSFFVVMPQQDSTLFVPGLLPAELELDELITDLSIDAAIRDEELSLPTISSTAFEIDFRLGDANRDFYIDEADIIRALQSDRFEDGQATNEEGDFDDDGDFDNDDLAAIASSEAYRAGAYRATTQPARNTRRRLDHANQATRLVYLPMTGSMIVTSAHDLSSIHVYSSNGDFRPRAVAETDSLNVQSEHSFFAVDPYGLDTDEILIRLSSGLTEADLRKDLSIDGSRVDGLPFGKVSLLVVSQLRIEAHCLEIRASGAIIGDANLDGIFNSTDIVLVFQQGHYEDDEIGNSRWYDGDWNCDGEFDSSDIIEAFRNGGFTFEARPRSAATAIRHLAEMEQNGRAFRPAELDRIVFDYDDDRLKR